MMDRHLLALNERNTSKLAATSNKVHLNVQVNRLDVQDHLIAGSKSICVSTIINRLWATQLRPSFAPA